jgi:succinate-semialdehyde dehydrogenase/glutarate-semialdehyde dehydrogenase
MTITGHVPDMNAQDAKTAINYASEAFEKWSQTTGKERHDLMKKLYSAIMENRENLAMIVTKENGKILDEAKHEVGSGASYFEWYVEEAVRMYGSTIPSPLPNQRTVTIKQPVDIVGIVTPWSKYFLAVIYQLRRNY